MLFVFFFHYLFGVFVLSWRADVGNDSGRQLLLPVGCMTRVLLLLYLQSSVRFSFMMSVFFFASFSGDAGALLSSACGEHLFEFPPTKYLKKGGVENHIYRVAGSNLSIAASCKRREKKTPCRSKKALNQN